MHAIKRFCPPGEVMAMICFLYSDDAGSIAGQDYRVDKYYI